MYATVRVRIGKERIFLGKGVRELLDAIDETHSIRKATQQTKISYPKALRMLRTMEEELGFAIVISEKGGSERGGTTLTDKGRQVLEAYREIESEVAAYADELLKTKFLF